MEYRLLDLGDGRFGYELMEGDLVCVRQEYNPNLPGNQAMTEEEARAAASTTGTTMYLPPTAITKVGFLKRFTLEERVAMRALAQADPIAGDILALMDAASEVDLTDPETVRGIHYFAMTGSLAEERVAAVLTP